MALFWHEVRVAVRMLRRAPSVTVPAILVLALSVGMTAALYEVVYAMWLRPLPYPDAARLVSVMTYAETYKLEALLSSDYGTWQGTRSLGRLAAYSTGNAAFLGSDQTVEVGRAAVSGNLLAVLGVRPVLGRGIEPADDRSDASPVAVLSDDFWRARFAADPAVIGRAIRLDDGPYTVIGVLPSGFRMPADARVDLLVPLAPDPAWLRHGAGHAKIWSGVARLEPGVTIKAARAELSGRLAASLRQDPTLYGGPVSLRLMPLQEYVTRDAHTAGRVLLGVIVVVLLIGTANVASLLVARAAGREREMKTRRALGAGPLRLANHLLLEGLLLGIAGTSFGILLAGEIVGAVRRTYPELSGRMQDLSLNSSVLIGSIAAALFCSLLFSLAPVLPLSRLRTRRILVVGELTLSLALVAAAGLLLRTLASLRSVNPGLRTEHVVAASLPLQRTRYQRRTADLRRDIRERLHAIPGVLDSTFADSLPPADAGRLISFRRADRADAEALSRGDKVIVRLVDASFFRAMAVPLVRGRVFTDADLAGNSLVAVINRALADRYFADDSPIGKQVDGPPWKTVIGIVADTRNDGLRNATRPEIYLPLTDRLHAEGGGFTRGSELNLVIRTAADPAATIPALLRQLHSVDPALIANVRTMDRRWADLTATSRFQALSFTAFAGLALVLACAGIYGLLSHVVVLRRREIAVRLALGARAADVQRLILREALLLALSGIGVGLAAAFAGLRLLDSWLYGVRSWDPPTLAATAAMLLICALAAGVLPAWRASRADPAQTLRAE